ncbi:hypothetical protein RJ639_039363 [Escallonia herrerae]|uniref:Uncharacterized protein n=1 Tax=Escallonia herrerae TaxID=1293975 RepID=A0AA88WJ32_9ASTE|nr:hypothetical protein RJ639_039363 [Escallonia herrerae]
MLRVVFSLSGGQSSGIHLLPGTSARPLSLLDLAMRCSHSSTLNQGLLVEWQSQSTKEEQQRRPKTQQYLQQQMQKQDIILQRQVRRQQQQQRDDTQHQAVSSNGTLAGRTSQIVNASSVMYSVQNDPLNDADMNLWIGKNVDQLDPSHTSVSNSAAIGGHSSSSNSILSLFYYAWLAETGRKGYDESNGSNHGVDNFLLKGWPLTGLEHLQPQCLQQQRSLIQSPQPLHQLQLQQRLMLQAQQNLPSSSAHDLECSKLRFLLNNHKINTRKDDQSNSVDEVFISDRSDVPVGLPMLRHADVDVLIKQLQNSNQHQGRYPRHALVSQRLLNPSYHLHQQDNVVGVSSFAGDARLSDTSQEMDKVYYVHSIYKPKPVDNLLFRYCSGFEHEMLFLYWFMVEFTDYGFGLLPGPANSLGSADTAGPSPSSAPSTPSTSKPGDVVSLPILTSIDASSKPIYITSENGVGKLDVANQSSDMDHFVDDGTLDDNVESFFTRRDADPGVEVTEGFTFLESWSVYARATDCCHFSPDGKLLATGGQDKRAILWCTDSREQMSTLEEHSHAITDIRFSPTMPWLATSSLDKTVRVWDVENPGYTIRTFTGHSSSVMSLDCHPKGDILCSCDDVNEIRYWSIKNGGCARVSEGGATQVRFQPKLGRYLAAAIGDGVFITDVETARVCGSPSKGHTLNIRSLCWDFSGERLASVSENSVRVWKIGSGAEQDCIHELSVTGKKFRCCVFHPYYPSLLVIGSYQSLELWNMAENKLMTPLEEPIAALAVSEISGLVASASHQDNLVKIWK